MKSIAKTLGALSAVVAIAAGLGATPAQAAFGLNGFEVSFTNEDGSPATQAGSHPFAMSTSFLLNTRIDPKFGEITDEELKSLRLQLPPGFAGSPTAVPRCEAADFLNVDEQGYPACPNNTAVGATKTIILHPGGGGGGGPVYNLTPPPGVAAKIGFFGAGIVPVTVELGVNGEAPNNITAGLINIPQATQFFGSRLEVWGNPAAPAHDPFRGRCLSLTGGTFDEFTSKGSCSAVGATEKPFITLPRACADPLITNYEVTSWQHPTAPPVKGSNLLSALSDCEKLSPFSADVKAQPTTTSVESASGLNFNIDIDDKGLSEPEGIAQSDIQKVVVTMPAGMTLNPSAAAGLAACGRAGYEAESIISQPGQGCPQASKVGEVEVETPLLEGEILNGSVFVASQEDNPFGTLLALYMVIKDPDLGILVKMAGRVDPSEESGLQAGRLVTTFEDIPQVPFSHFRFRFNAGPRGPLVTPPACGPYNTEIQLTPRAEPGKPLNISAGFGVSSGLKGGPCPSGTPPFKPGFEAGTTNNTAGSYSPFNMRLTRDDGEQDLTRFSAVLPPGVVAKIAGVAKCSDAAIATARVKSGRQELIAPSCPAASQVGHVLGGAGVGATLTYVPGNLYLAGPFGGNPLSAVAVVPAIAGPFDVGTVVTRVGLTLNPVTGVAEVDSAASEPIPHILRGIPLRLRDLRANVDRPDFTLNATGCEYSSTKATVFGGFLDVFNPADDTPASSVFPYQAANCAALGFKPKLSLALKGGTRRGGHPALKSVVTYPRGSGYSNIGKAVVTLPPSELIDNAHIQNPCTRVQFAANQCPKGSILGTARATSPLLDEPLEGQVYFRSNGGERLLPDIVADLKGLFHIVLVGQVDSTKARIRTTFDGVPDAPVSKFTLNLNGGKKGLLVNNRDLCASKLKATVVLIAQSAKREETKPVVKTSCGGGRPRR